MHARARLTGVAGVDVTTGRRDAVAWAEEHRSYADTGVFESPVEEDAGSVRKKL